jgi:integrase
MARPPALAARLATAPERTASEELTTGAYLERWLSHAHARVRLKTYEGYETLLRCHAQSALGRIPLAKLHPLDLQELYAHLLRGDEQRRPLAAGTVLNLHLVLSQALGQAVRWQLLASNPATGAQPPRPRRRAHTAADPATITVLLTGLRGHPLELPAALAIATGARRGELLALRWRDLTDDYRHARIERTLQPTSDGLIYELPKTARSRRNLALPAFVNPYLQAQRRDQHRRQAKLGASWHNHDLIIDRGDGRPLNPDTLSTGWSRVIRQRKLPKLRFHDLRHSHATLMLVQGVHPKIVSERLGHASIGITLDTYTHVLPSLQQQAADAFDDLFPTAETHSKTA